jgi:hypothetical protein
MRPEKFKWMSTVLGGALSLVCAASLQAGTLYVPNRSFESPATAFVDTRIDSWQKNPNPGYTSDTNWDQSMGIFLNTSPTNSDHIDNMDGNQALFMFSGPGIGMFQDYNSIDWAHASPTHEFNAKFQVGKAYNLVVGVIGGGGGMAPGASMQISLYYRDVSNNVVTVAATPITNSTDVFPNNTHFIDFKVQVPKVKPGDAWAGQNIGVSLLSTVDFSLAFGYWDIDNVRLTEEIEVPNGSFESPPTAFVDTRIDSWQKTPNPGFTTDAQWDQGNGVFLNTSPTNSDHIDNCDGLQAAYMFNGPLLGIFQDYISTDWSNAVPTHAFDETFTVGKSYDLTVGIIGGGGGMQTNATMMIGLYYRDASSNMITITATSITNNPQIFTNTIHLIDFTAHLPTIKAGAAWAGKKIGVEILSTAGFDPNNAGYWDFDNVRLMEVLEPTLQTPVRTNGHFQFTLQSEPGLRFDILTSSNVTLPSSSWTSLGIVTNTPGMTTFTDPALTSGQRFYRAHQLP